MTEKRSLRKMNFAFGMPADTPEDHAERVVSIKMVRVKLKAFSERRDCGFGVTSFSQRRTEQKLRVDQARLKPGHGREGRGGLPATPLLPHVHAPLENSLRFHMQVARLAIARRLAPRPTREHPHQQAPLAYQPIIAPTVSVCSREGQGPAHRWATRPARPDRGRRSDLSRRPGCAGRDHRPSDLVQAVTMRARPHSEPPLCV